MVESSITWLAFEVSSAPPLRIGDSEALAAALWAGGEGERARRPELLAIASLTRAANAACF